MYVACRELKVHTVGSDGKPGPVRIVKPGEPVPEVFHWEYQNILAHVNLEWIKWNGEKTAFHETHKGGNVVIPLIFKQMRPKKPQTASHPVESGALNSSSSPTPHAAVSSPPKGVQKPNWCSECSKGFKSPKALKTHASIKHRVTDAPKAG